MTIVLFWYSFSFLLCRICMCYFNDCAWAHDAHMASLWIDPKFSNMFSCVFSLMYFHVCLPLQMNICLLSSWTWAIILILELFGLYRKFVFLLILIIAINYIYLFKLCLLCSNEVSNSSFHAIFHCLKFINIATYFNVG